MSKKTDGRYQVGFEDVAGVVDRVVVLRQEEDGPEVAGEAKGQDEGEEGPHSHE